MLDANLASDDAKLEYIAGLPGGRQLIVDLVDKETPVVISRLQKRFGLRDMLSDHSKDRIFIVSFLYYFGVLTLAGETEKGELCLKVPNLVTQGLYVERVQQMLLPDPVIRDRGLDAARRVYQFGEIEPVCQFVQDVYFPLFSNRDYAQLNELTVKTCFLTLLYNDVLYIMDSEPELERRYADLTMIIRPDKRHFTIYDVLIEFKLLSLKTLGLSGERLGALSQSELYALPAVQQAMNDGKKQAMDYANRLARKYPRLNLKAFVVVSLGMERICFVHLENR
jgi:hypothetical protein